jgi:hypothetical protein
MPQVAPLLAQVTVDLQPHAPSVPPPPQVSGGVHVPQLRTCPQPSESMPQVTPDAAHVVGAQPQRFGTPEPPHVAGAVQLPQPTNPPQTFATAPQFAPTSAQFVSVHPH